MSSIEENWSVLIQSLYRIVEPIIILCFFYLIWMNLSKTHDPFRFLKRKKNVTPQKLKDNSLEEHYRIIPDHLTSLA